MTGLLKSIPGKKRLLAELFKFTGVLAVAKKTITTQLVIFNYHRILDPRNPTPFDDSVFGPDEESFRKHLQWMKKNGDPISEEDLLKFVYEKKPLPKQAFLVTFDDGYSDNFTKAFPILKEQRVPAIFFLPTSSILKRELGWWDEIYWCLKHATKRQFSFQGIAIDLDKMSLRHAAEIFIQKKKLEAQNKTASLIEELRQSCQSQPIPFDRRDKELMTLEQAKECLSGGVRIGSHTHSHRVLATLSLEEQRKELTDSKQILEETLSTPILSLAYPVGGYEHFNTETPTIAKECGYKLAFSFLTGTNPDPAKQFNPFDIRRIDIPSSETVFSAVFSIPSVFAKRSCALAATLPNTPG